MKWFLMVSLITLAFLAMPQEAKADSADSAEIAVCAPPYPIVATANNGAGYINFCVYYPPVVATSSSTFQVTSIITAPTTVLPVFGTAASAFAQNSGCTEGTATVNPPVTNGVVGTMNTFASVWTMTGEQCDGNAGVSLTIAAAPINIYLAFLPVTVQTENRRMDLFDFGCGAPGIVPNSYSTTATNCGTPTVNTVLSGTLTLAGTINVVNSGGQTITISSWPTLNAVLSGGLTITDDANGWIIHQDPLSGTINVVNSGGQDIAITSWPELVATISGSLDVNGNFTFTGNFTDNTNMTTPPEEPDQLPLYILFLGLALFLIWLGESRQDYFTRVFGAVLMMVVGFIGIWEQAILGFDHVPHLVIPMLGFTILLGAYFLIPKKWRTEI